jgi:hypothetical protein
MRSRCIAHQREAMEEAFDAPVRETYGMSELAAAAGECEEGPDALVPRCGGGGDSGARGRMARATWLRRG